MPFDPVIEWLEACLTLLRKFPSATRERSAASIPFTGLELSAPGPPSLAHRRDKGDTRLDASAHVGSAQPHIDGAPMPPPSDFLAQLRPHLDLWSERELVDAEISRLSRNAADNDSRRTERTSQRRCRIDRQPSCLAAADAPLCQPPTQVVLRLRPHLYHALIQSRL